MTRKRRLSTPHMVGPDAGPTTETLRIYVHHHVLRQPVAPSTGYTEIGSRSRGGASAGGPFLPSWVLRIEGGVLEPRGSRSGKKGARRLSPHFSFTEFFDSISITGLDPQPGRSNTKNHGNSHEDDVEWVRDVQAARPQETDGLELTTPLSGVPEGITYRLRIYLHRRQGGEGWARRRKVSPELAKVLHLRKEERQETIEAALLELVSARQLQAPRQPGWIVCDEELCRLFGLQEGVEEGSAASKVHLSSLAERLEAHLSAPEPLVLDYKVTPSDEAQEGEGKGGEKGGKGGHGWRRKGKVFDVEVETEPGRGSLQASVAALVAEEARKRQAGGGEEEEATRRLDRQIAYVGSLLVEKSRKLARLRAVAEDPVRGVARLQAEHEAAAMLVGEDSLPAVAGLLQTGKGKVNVGTETGAASSRWLMQALQQYLTQPASLR